MKRKWTLYDTCMGFTFCCLVIAEYAWIRLHGQTPWMPVPRVGR